MALLPFADVIIPLLNWAEIDTMIFSVVEYRVQNFNILSCVFVNQMRKNQKRRNPRVEVLLKDCVYAKWILHKIRQQIKYKVQSKRGLNKKKKQKIKQNNSHIRQPLKWRWKYCNKEIMMLLLMVVSLFRVYD